MYQRLASEEECIGEHFYKAACPNFHEKLNRFLLTELMHQHSLQLANSYFQHGLEETITYRDFGVELHKLAEANPNRLAQLDVALVLKNWLHTVRDVRSLPNAALATQHFAVMAELDIELRKDVTQRRPQRKQITALKDIELQNRFAALVEENLSIQALAQSEDVNERQTALEDAFGHAKAIFPEYQATPHKPWITTATLTLIDQRTTARHNKDSNTERELTQQIKKSVQNDKRAWLENLAGTGKWDDIKFLRQKTKPKQGRLRDSEGNLVDISAKRRTPLRSTFKICNGKSDRIVCKRVSQGSMTNCKLTLERSQLKR